MILRQVKKCCYEFRLLSRVTGSTRTISKLQLVDNYSSELSFQQKYDLINMQKYEDAIAALNGLQSNASILQQNRKEKKARESNSLQLMESFLSRINLKVSDLEQLNIIHISGTKGKGSVGALCESIMRHSGFRTGFYSSPHLVEVRERIRINGRPLERDKFTKSFFQCYDALMATKDEFGGSMPAYFRFLTLLAFHVFLEEKLDVVVMEVGIGGSYDCTNVIRKPAVCGITKLELDHTSILGDTIQQIAWHKSGIMKPAVPVLALPQVDDAEVVLAERTKELMAYLKYVPSLDSYDSEVGVDGKFQETNASLALQLCRLWLYQRKKFVLEKMGNTVPSELSSLINTDPSLRDGSKYINPFKLPSSFIEGIKKVSWPGRCQLIKRKNITFYIDGAHTLSSMESCAGWVKSRQDKDITVPRDQVFRVLVFNVTGDRDECSFLEKLIELDFDHAVFCPSILDSAPGSGSSDLTNFNVSKESKLKTCEKNFNCWLSLQNDSTKRMKFDSNNINNDNSLETESSSATCFPCVSSAIRWLARGRDEHIELPDADGPVAPSKLNSSKHVQIVVTGSLHLVGTVMKFLGPNICEI